MRGGYRRGAGRGWRSRGMGIVGKTVVGIAEGQGRALREGAAG